MTDEDTRQDELAQVAQQLQEQQVNQELQQALADLDTVTALVREFCESRQRVRFLQQKSRQQGDQEDDDAERD